tara:strand:+ start:642 stop:1349 length:708 start_codon:yes stop_codon:yes gene_type:complete
MTTETTTTETGRECPSDAAIRTAAVKCGKVGDGKFAAAYALETLVPRSVEHWRQRDGAKMSEKDIFEAIADAKDEKGNPLVDESANTLIQWRNVAAAFPKAVRVAGVSFGAHKALQALAWKNDGARRSQLCEWMATNKPTEAEAVAHAKAIRLKDSPPTDPVEEGEGDGAPSSAADVNGPAVTSITGDELVAAVVAATAAHDGSDPSDMDAGKRAVENFAVAIGWTLTRKADVSV